LRFDSTSGASLSAWFVPGRPGAGAVLLLHGVRSNKRAMLPRARFLSDQGYAVLLIDLQAHGESAGERITFGHREAADVRAAIAKLGELAMGERVGVLGVSLGAASFVLSGAQVSAAVLESLYPTIEEAVANRLRIRFGVLGARFTPLLLMQLDPRLNVEPEALRPIERVGSMRSPTLLVHGTEDRHTTLAEARRIFDAIPQPKELYLLPGAAHVDLHRYAGEAYAQRIGHFFARHLRASP